MLKLHSISVSSPSFLPGSERESKHVSLTSPFLWALLLLISCVSHLSIRKSHFSLCWETLLPLSSRASPAHLSGPHLRSTYLFRLWEHLSTWWSRISTEDSPPLADPGSCFHWSISLHSAEAPLHQNPVPSVPHITSGIDLLLNGCLEVWGYVNEHSPLCHILTFWTDV